MKPSTEERRESLSKTLLPPTALTREKVNRLIIATCVVYVYKQRVFKGNVAVYKG